MLDLALAIGICSIIALFITPVDEHVLRFTHFRKKDPMEIIYTIKQEEERLLKAITEVPKTESNESSNKTIIKSQFPYSLIPVTSTTSNNNALLPTNGNINHQLLLSEPSIFQSTKPTNFIFYVLTNSLIEE
ncbi:hypothetical protein ABK040_016629 [Willaertia magna]